MLCTTGTRQLAQISCYTNETSRASQADVIFNGHASKSVHKLQQDWLVCMCVLCLEHLHPCKLFQQLGRFASNALLSSCPDIHNSTCITPAVQDDRHTPHSIFKLAAKFFTSWVSCIQQVLQLPVLPHMSWYNARAGATGGCEVPHESNGHTSVVGLVVISEGHVQLHIVPRQAIIGTLVRSAAGSISACPLNACWAHRRIVRTLRVARAAVTAGGQSLRRTFQWDADTNEVLSVTKPLQSRPAPDLPRGTADGCRAQGIALSCSSAVKPQGFAWQPFYLVSHSS